MYYKNLSVAGTIRRKAWTLGMVYSLGQLNVQLMDNAMLVFDKILRWTSMKWPVTPKLNPRS